MNKTRLILLLISCIFVFPSSPTSAQRRGQAPGYSYPPRLLEEIKRLQQAALASDYALKQTAFMCNNIGPRFERLAAGCPRRRIRRR